MEDLISGPEQWSPPLQRRSGRFVAGGRSPNPGGRPAATTSDGRSLPQLCRDFSEDAIRALHEIAMNLNNPPGLRAQAAEAILRRGWADKPRVDPAANRQIVVTTIAHDDPRLVQWEAQRLEAKR